MLSIEKDQIMMEHYQKVLSVSSSCIHVGFATYTIKVMGSELRILALAASEIYMAGKLESIEFLYEK